MENTTTTEERSRSRINWKTILVTAVVTGAVTISANLILGWIQSKPAKLVYTVNRTIPFPSATGSLGIYQVTIANEGKTEVESVSCGIHVEGATIKDKRIEGAPVLNWLVAATNDTLTLTSVGLNAGEKINISILAEAPKDLPPVPVVSLRGKGVTGEIKDDGKKSTGSMSLLTALVGILGGLTVLSQLLDRSMKKDWKRRETIEKSRMHAPNQRLFLAHLCQIYGLEDAGKSYLEQSRPTEYWFEAEQLTKKALESKSPEFCSKVKNVLFALIKSAAVADTSIAIAMICIAKIEWTLGNRIEAKKLVVEASGKNQLFFNTWKTIDPNLEEILRISVE